MNEHIYSVLYRNDDINASPMGVLPGQHGVREFRAEDGATAMKQFKEMSIFNKCTVIAVICAPFYEVSVMV